MTDPTTSQGSSTKASTGHTHRVCPWWLGYLLASPLRKLGESPDRLLRPYVRPGMKVLDFGSAMGFFSLPAARMVGETGRVTCVDLQPKMLASLRRRAKRAGLSSRIDTVLCPANDLGPIGATPFDLVLAIHVLHEVPDAAATLRGLAGALAAGGHLLLIEPAGHVTAAMFAREVDDAIHAGLSEEAPIPHRRAHGALFRKGA